MTATAILFPGQGAQTVGMGQQLFEQLPQARSLFERANQILNYDLAQICFDGPKETLDATEHSQPALFVSGLAALELLKIHRPHVVDQCRFAAGLSLGEYTAMVLAQSISFEDGLQLVRQRGLAMQAASDQQPSGMVSILGLETEAVQQLCDDARQPGEVLQIANLLCPGNIAISGHQASCQRAIAMAPQRGALRAVPLAVAGAFHTPLMEPAKDQLRQALAETQIRPPALSVISNVDAKSHDDPADIRQVLVQQVSSPVLWEQSMRTLIEAGVGEFYEVGTGRVLRGLMKRIDRSIPCLGVDEITTES